MLRYLCEVSTNRRAPCCKMKYKLDGDFRAMFWPSFCQIINQKSVTSLVQKTKQSVIIIDGYDRYHWVCLPSYQLNRLYYKVRQVLYLESATELIVRKWLKCYVCNLFQSSPSLAILAPPLLVGVSFVFFYLTKLIF